MKPCLILINGYPGVGKYTIAKHIHGALGAVESTFIHNHLLIDLVEAIYPGRTSAHYALRKKFRDLAFGALIADPRPERFIIFTVCLGENEDDIAVMYEHLQIARERCLPVCWVNLTCDDEEEHNCRIASEQRKASGKSKCTDPEVLKEMKTKSGAALLRAADIAAHIEDLLVSFCVQDTSGMSAEGAARLLLHWMRGK